MDKDLEIGSPSFLIKFKEGVILKLSMGCSVALTGNITLDRLNMEFQVVRIKELMPLLSGQLNRSYLFTVAQGIDVQEAIKAYLEHPLVEYAEVNAVVPLKPSERKE